MSLPEVMLWQELRKRPGGLKFRRQHAIGDYVLDFYCVSARLAVEIDGHSHDCADRPNRDVARDKWLVEHGIRCVRIAAARVLTDPASIAAWLGATAATEILPVFGEEDRASSGVVEGRSDWAENSDLRLVEFVPGRSTPPPCKGMVPLPEGGEDQAGTRLLHSRQDQKGLGLSPCR